MLVPRSDLVEGPQPMGVEGNSNKYINVFPLIAFFFLEWIQLCQVLGIFGLFHNSGHSVWWERKKGLAYFILTLCSAFMGICRENREDHIWVGGHLV